MFTTKFVTRTIAIVTVCVLAFSGVFPAYAAPSNDNFAEATQIVSLPFSTNSNNTGATYESFEPYPSCGWGNQLSTVWFTYTPSSNDVALTVKTSPSNITPLLGVYTGTSIDNLTQVGCQYYGWDFSFQPQAGQTYYFQVSGLYGDAGNFSFALDITHPQVSFSYGPSDASIFDNVSFYPYVNDPFGCCSSIAWTLSDGTTSDQYYFNHQFAADGDYTVNLTATTFDGRSGSASQVVHVLTKDVAITTFSVPQTARVNQTKTINVNIQNKRYSDYVQVTLYKGTPTGDVQIGILTIYVPARASRPTTFKFSYTFTSSDATIGKVTFKAVATIINSRDALPADNTSIATTTVSR